MARAGAPSVQQLDSTAVRMDRLEACVRALDPGSRALLDLSLRHRVRDDEMAPVLMIDPFNLAWRRARAIERIATLLDLDDPTGIARVRAALPGVRDDAWGVPALLPPGPKREELPETAATTAGTALVPASTSPSESSQPVRGAVAVARHAAAARPEQVRAAARGALLAGAGALVGRLFSRRRRR